MNWIIGLLVLTLAYILGKNLLKRAFATLPRLLSPFLISFGGRALQAAKGGRYQLSREKLWRHAGLSAALGAALITFPGFWLGKIDLFQPFWFWLGTLLVFLTPVVLKVWFLIGAYRKPLLLQPKAARPLALTASLTLLAFLFGFILTGYFWWFTGQFALVFAKRRVGAAGYSFDWPKAPPQVPEDENAVTFLKKAVECKSALRLFTSQDPDFNKPFYQKKNESEFLVQFRDHLKTGSLTAGETAAMRKLLQAHEESVKLVELAGEKKTIDWKMDFTVTPPEKIELPRVAGYLTLSKLLACRAVLEARDGRPGEALKSLQAGLFTAQAVGEMKFIIGEMIAVAIVKNTMEAAPEVLAHGDPVLFKKEIFPILKTQDWTGDFQRAIQLDYFAYHDWLGKAGWIQLAKHSEDGLFEMGCLCEPGEEESRTFENTLGFLFGFFYRPFLPFDLAAGYENKLKEMSVLNLPYSQRQAAHKKLQEETKRTTWLLGSLGETGYFHMYQEKVLEAVTDSRLTHAAVEARLFHSKNKRWPDAVWELDRDKKEYDEFWDPYSDRANLRIIRYGNGILIYSLGPSGIDNQGKPSLNDGDNGNFRWILE